MKLFTKKELSKYNGQNGKASYIAYRGKVYDVTQSFLWLGGRHQVTHNAGQDLSIELDAAPHNDDLLKKFPVVGYLVEKS